MDFTYTAAARLHLLAMTFRLVGWHILRSLSSGAVNVGDAVRCGV